MKKILLLSFFACIMYTYATSQTPPRNVLISETSGAIPDTSAILDVQSTTKGFQMPRMTEAQRIAIPFPGKGLLVYQIDNDSGYYSYSGSAWEKLIGSTPTCKSIIPLPAFPIDNMGYTTLYSNIVASMSEIHIPLKVSIQKITIETNNPPSVPGKIKIALYSETGQNKIFEIVTDSIFNNGPVVTSLNIPIDINPGLYYISVMSLGNCNIQIMVYLAASFGYYLFNPSSDNKLQGYMNVTPDTLPSSFNPSLIIYENARCLGFRIN